MDETEFTQGQYASFLVRLWHSAEPEPGGSSGDWQGEIEHIQSGRRRLSPRQPSCGSSYTNRWPSEKVYARVFDERSNHRSVGYAVAGCRSSNGVWQTSGARPFS